LPYMIGSYTVDTTRLRQMLGGDYETVMEHTVAEALADSFNEPTGATPTWKRPLKLQSRHGEATKP
jgi:hypothetical protein